MIKKFKGFAGKEGDSADVVFNRLLILVIAVTCCFCGLIWSAVYCAVFGFGVIASLPLLFVIVVGVAIPVAHFLRNYKILVYAQIVCIIWVTALIQWAIGGIHESGYVTAWSLVGPIVALIFLSLKDSLVWMGMFVLIIVVSVVVEPSLTGQRSYPSRQAISMFYIMNIGMASIVVFSASAWFALTIKKEKMIADDLLLNILPADVARELKVSGMVEPRTFENVTVLFVDFVDFTHTVERLSAKEMLSEIHNCFSAFDDIISGYRMEKIKTIGDAYIAVCGLPLPDDRHAEQVVRAAKEMASYMDDRHKQLGDKSFQARVGVNSGSVIAGVVGKKKFAYDIWGDTVNTAARMEQSCEAGRVNISQSTYELVKHNIPCYYRGEIHAKGKGHTRMYYVA